MSLLTVILLLICTCTYIRSLAPNLFDKRLGKVGVLFGNVLGLAKEKVHTWLSVASLWPLAFYFGHRVHSLLANGIWVRALYVHSNITLMYLCMKAGNENKKAF